MSNIRISDSGRCSVWGLALIALTVGLIIGGCNSQPGEIFFYNLEVGDQLTVAIDPLQTSVFRDKDGGITSYYIVVSKDGKVVCKASAANVLRMPTGIYLAALKIDSRYIASLIDYARLLYKDGNEPTDSAKAEAAKIENRDGVRWSNLASEFFGWPVKATAIGDNPKFLRIYQDNRRISDEDFAAMCKNGKLTGTFAFYDIVPSKLKYTPEMRKQIAEDEDYAELRKALAKLLDLGVKYGSRDRKSDLPPQK